MTNDSSVARVTEAIRQVADTEAPGSRLPSTRELQRELAVGPVTVRRALAQLVAEGVVVTRPGAGTFTAAGRRARVDDTDWQQVALGASPVRPSGLEMVVEFQRTAGYCLGAGLLDTPLRADGRLAAAGARAARRPDAWAPPPPEGLPELRSWFAREIGAEPEDVLVTPGSQAALSAAFRALLPAGSPVLFAVPTYPGALAVAASAGLVAVPVPGDRDGIRPDLLERALRTTGARLLFLQPTFANPDGSVLTEQRRAEVLDACAAAGAFVVEDDYARWLDHGPVTPPPLWRSDGAGRVITICSLTKIIAPGLRIGAMLARGPVRQRVAAQRMVDDFYVGATPQLTAVEMVTGPAWPVQRRNVSAALRDRSAVLGAQLARELPDCSFEPPRGGLGIWLRLPPGSDDLAIARRAIGLGVSVMPGRYFTIGEQTEAHLRLSVLGIDAADIPAAVALLARAVRA